jgi:hypothetical protein
MRPVLEIPEIRAQIKDVHAYRDALTIDRLGFVGPLQHPNAVKVDISFRETVQLKPRQAILRSPCLPPFAVTCMALEEILAEKVRAALVRRTPRDSFDLHNTTHGEAHPRHPDPHQDAPPQVGPRPRRANIPDYPKHPPYFPKNTPVLPP